MERDGEFEIGTDANAGRMTSPKVFAGETLLGGRGPFHTFFHGGSAGRDVAD